MSIAEQLLEVLLDAALAKREKLQYELRLQANVISELREKIVERDHGVKRGTVFESPSGEVFCVSSFEWCSGESFQLRVRRRKKNGEYEDRERTLYEFCGDDWRNWKRLD